TAFNSNTTVTITEFLDGLTLGPLKVNKTTRSSSFFRVFRRGTIRSCRAARHSRAIRQQMFEIFRHRRCTKASRPDWYCSDQGHRSGNELKAIGRVGPIWPEPPKGDRRLPTEAEAFEDGVNVGPVIAPFNESVH